MNTSLQEIDFDFIGEDTSYLTHSFHPYPAKFPPQLPKQILLTFSKQGETVLDPFCGSGTTMVEARLQGINSVGVDVNGLACLLSKVKSTPLFLDQCLLIEKIMQEIANESFYWQMGDKQAVQLPNIEGLAHWFQTNVAEELTFLRKKIETISDNDVKDFFKVVLSSIIVRVSNQESDTRFAAINKNIPDSFALKIFLEKANEFYKRIKIFSEQATNKVTVKVFNADSRDLSFLKSESFDLIITSPPYANTYDYYLYHKFRKRWLDLDVAFAQYNEIGSRREFSSLKKSTEKWVEDLQKSFAEMSRVLKAGKQAFIVIGDSVIRKQLLKIDEAISGFAHSVGFKVIDIVSSDLANHSRLFNPAFVQRGKKEHLILLTKFNG
jgi:site-specific DNA-methyltransferase (cytosine-N4-specific)